MVSLDGGNRVVGTEFVKLLNTGSSDLATEEYVLEQVALGGGGNVDLSNYYTQTETDNLLNAKLNVNNPQDIIGTLRIDSTNGNGKLIVNAVGAPNDEDFYVNGLSNLGGTLKAQVIQASSNIQTSQQIQSNVINTYSNSNLIIQRNAIPYITLDSQIIDDETVEKFILMKDVEFSGGLSLNTLSVDTLNTIGLNDMVFNINTLGEMLRLEVGGTVRVPNNRSFISQNIFTDIIKPLTFSTDVVFNGGNSTNDAYEEYLRLDASTEKVSVSKTIDTNEHIYMNLNKRLYLNDTVGSERYIVSTFRSGTPSFNQLDIVNENSSNGRIRLMIDTEENVIVENSQLYSRRVITANAGVNSNTYNSNGDNVVNLQQNGNTFISLSGNNNRVNVNRLLRVVDSGNSTQCQFIQSSNGNYMSFTLGNHIGAYSSGGANGNTLHLNYYSHANVFLGTNQDTTPDPKPTITINKFSSNTGNAFEVAGDSQFSGDIVIDTGKSVKTNTINSNGDTNLVFKRNGVDMFQFLTYTPVNGPTKIVDGLADVGFSAQWMFSDVFANRTGNSNTTFRGAVNGGLASGKVYMTYLYASETLDFDCAIDNTGRSVIGNILDTTVSDERLKTNIEDVETDFTSCIKNVKVKTFKYKDDKYKTNDNYGFIAQELKEHLPKECKNIVKENKVKNEDETFLSINYMKLSVVLWKCCQEQQSKIEHLEARLFEVEDIIKEMRGKGKGEAKPKAKAKAKAKNVD